MEYYIRKTDPYYLFHDHISTQFTLLFLLAPLDRVKTILQIQSSSPQSSPPLPSARSICSHIYSKQGIQGFWRGSLLPLIFFPPTKIIAQNLQKFSQSLDIFDPSTSPSLSKLEKLALNNPVIWTWGLFLYPVYTIKSQMNLELSERKDLKSLSSSMSKVLKAKPSQLYSGFFFTFYLPYCISQTIEDKVRVQMGSEAIRNSTVFALAMITAGSIIKLITYPFETVQYRLMLHTGSTSAKFKSPGEVLTHVMRSEGYRGLYKGFGLDLFSTLFKLLYISYSNSYF